MLPALREHAEDQAVPWLIICANDRLSVILRERLI